jgi:hypothetical protein
VRAYKFLLPGAVGPFSGFHWPEPADSEPGAWVDADAGSSCTSGVHACAAADLPYWLLPELWEIELGGEPSRVRHKLVAPRGRLWRRIEEWNPDTMAAFSAGCVERLRGLAARRPEAEGHLGDVERFLPHVHAAAVASLSARASEAVEGAAGYDAERQAQAEWLARRFGFEPLTVAP